jgi:hypothetical protein
MAVKSRCGPGRAQDSNSPEYVQRACSSPSHEAWLREAGARPHQPAGRLPHSQRPVEGRLCHAAGDGHHGRAPAEDRSPGDPGLGKLHHPAPRSAQSADPRVGPIGATNRELEGLRMVAKGLGNKEITSALLESASGMRGVASRWGFGRCLRGFSSIAIPRSRLRSEELIFCSADDVAAHQSLWHRDGGVAVTIPC